jgi:sarcosine oxidase
MAQRALALWRDLERDAEDELVVTTGGLDAGPTAERCAEALASCGAEFEWLSGEECEERFPGVAAEGRVLFQPDAGACLADQAVAAQVRLAAAAGVEVRPEVGVVSLRPRDDGVAVDTDAGPIEAQTAVLTAGAWVQRILPHVPVTPTVQTVSYFRPLDDDASWPTFIEWEGEDGFVWYEVPAAGGAPGAKVAEHRPGPRVDPSHGPFDPDPSAVEATADYVRRRFPGLEPQPLSAETCLYEMTPDEDFVIDRNGPIVVGAGGSGHSFKFAPLLGEILADLVVGRDPDVSLGRFSVSRFA